MENLKCKGARDLLPLDMERFRFIEDTFRRCCTNWGYQEIKTPTLEYLHLFTSAGTLSSELLNKVYSFLDWDGWSGERVVLRPDGTIPVARLYIENMIKQKMAKLSYVADVFKFEETGTENRERWQCGVEYIGNSSSLSDVETILLSKQILKSVGIDKLKIQLSHAGILRSLLRQLKLDSDQEQYLVTQLRKGNWKALSRYTKLDDDTDRILNLITNIKGKSSGFLENLRALPKTSAKLTESLYNFAEIAHLLDIANCQYRIDFTSTDGFEYYTGLYFQLFVDDQKIGGGGRYDDLIPLIGNKKKAACGFALYIDPIMDIIKPINSNQDDNTIVIEYNLANSNLNQLTMELAQALRDAGYATQISFFSGKSISRWQIEINEATGQFTIADNQKKISSKEINVLDVLNYIRGNL